MSETAERLGFYGEPADEEAEGVRLAELGVTYACFLRAGGRPTFAEFCAFTPEERATFALVGDRVQAKIAVQIARAARSELGEAGVLAVIDDGDALVQASLSRFMDRSP